MNSTETEMEPWSYTQYLLGFHVTEQPEIQEIPQYERVEEDEPEFGW